MKFYFTTETAETIAHAAEFAHKNYACDRCESENTVESVNLVPSGTHHKVICERGHETNGMPPKSGRASTRDEIEAQLKAAKIAARNARKAV